MLAVSLAILSAAVWGGADYLGGVSARRVAALVVSCLSQLAGLLSVGLLVLVLGEPLSTEGALYGVAAGIVGSMAIAVFYAALAAGVMSLVAPLSALGAVVPLTVAVAGGDVPGPVAAVGMVAALGGVLLIARREEAVEGLKPRVVALSAAAALGIGAALTFLQLGADAAGSSGLGVVAAARVASVLATLIALAVTRTRPQVTRAELVPIALIGLGDTGANALFAVASETGSNALVAVLGSLYPVTTLLLARALLAERLSPRQAAGVALALGGAAMITAG